MSYQDLIKAAQDVVSHFNNIGYGLGLVNRIGLLEEALENETLTEPISFSAITQALDYEIEWSKNNVHLTPNQNDVDWFVKGLEQAKWLILELSKVDYQEPLAEPDSSKKKSSQVSFAFGEGGNLENMTDENYGCPGWMGDYGATPFEPVDV